MIQMYRKRKKLLIGLAVSVVGIIHLFAFILIAVPPPGFPADGHDPALVLENGSIIPISDSDRDLFQGVATFHTQIQAHVESGNSYSGQVCLSCHGNIFELETVMRKMPTEDGKIELSEEPNHHSTHQSKSEFDFSDACTFCHVGFEIENTEEQVTISGYVDKTICAGCHSRFSPRGLMQESYYEESGCPGCHDPEDDGEWIPLHRGHAFKFIPYAPYFNYSKFQIGPIGCLLCHGNNKMQMPEFIQDIFWEDRTERDG